MTIEMIKGRTRAACLVDLQKRLNDYWSRLQAAGANRGLITKFPEIKQNHDVSQIECILGGPSAYEHAAMGTPIEVAELFERCQSSALLVGSPPCAAVVGIQRFALEESADEVSLRTTSYKYTVLYRSDGSTGWRSASSSLRLESDTAAGVNSWLLNHPIHHYQPGDSKELRFKASEGHSLVGFVDWVLRAFGDNIWSELYPNLFLELKEEGGKFNFLTSAKSGKPISAKSYQQVQEVLRAGRAERTDWFVDLELWNQETTYWSEPELDVTDLFRDRSLFNLQ